MATSSQSSVLRGIVGLILIVAAIGGGVFLSQSTTSPEEKSLIDPAETHLAFKPRKLTDISGFMTILSRGPKWRPDSSFAEIAALWDRRGFKLLGEMNPNQNLLQDPRAAIDQLLGQILVYNYEGRAAQAYDFATEAREVAATSTEMAEEWLFTCIYAQGVCALRRGEDENCIMCRGESSCIIPISAAAVHTNPKGSQLAVRHFTEYLNEFPNDLEARWLLNLAHMTLGEHPHKVDPRFLINLDKFRNSEFDIGRFRDVGHLVGVNRLNQAGSAILEDFDGDGLLDLAVTTMDPMRSMAFYKNKGDGTFEERTESAGISGQLGGLFCSQTDFNNDGFPDIFICRGAWFDVPMRPSLLRNNRNGTFTDVTVEAGVSAPVNSISACWGDYDNDGFLDLFICCETTLNKLYRNKGNGTFEEVAGPAGVAGKPGLVCKGANWIDFDNDGYQDLYLSHLSGGTGQLFKNNRNGTFTDITAAMGIEGPELGFSCWAWDYDNDGFLDIFATSYVRPISELVRGLQGEPTTVPTSRLFHNLGGKRFEDVSKAAGLDKPYATMGSNFADFDNDGYLDFYLGTGDPNIDMLVPNRMFKNVGGKRFAEISGSSGTGHLQKGHGVSIGDWDRSGSNSIAIQMGGAIPGDQYHNILFQNPGQGNNWLNLKLVGTKTNRPAVGARIKVVTDGPNPLTVYRTIGTGSSFGANPFEQVVGIGKADRIALLEITWPTSQTTQTFRDVKVNQALEITEFAKDFRVREYKRIPLPVK